MRGALGLLSTPSRAVELFLLVVQILLKSKGSFPMASMRAGQVTKITWEEEPAQASFTFYLHELLKKQESNTKI